MLIDLYLDIPPSGTFNPKDWYFNASSINYEVKLEGWTRLKIKVDIPDVYIQPPYDAVAPVESVTEVDKTN